MEVGDVVRVKSYMKEGETDGLYFSSHMEQYKGKTFKIMYKFSRSGLTQIKLGNLDGEEDYDLGQWSWLEEWLEPVTVRNPIEVML